MSFITRGGRKTKCQEKKNPPGEVDLLPVIPSELVPTVARKEGIYARYETNEMLYRAQSATKTSKIIDFIDRHRKDIIIRVFNWMDR